MLNVFHCFAVELVSDCIHKIVSVHQKGSNPSSIDNVQLEKNCKAVLRENIKLCIVEGKYPHVVKFKPVETNGNQSKSKNCQKQKHETDLHKSDSKLKRSADRDSDDSPKAKKQKTSRQSHVSDSDSDSQNVEDIKAKLNQLKETMKKSKPEKPQNDDQQTVKKVTDSRSGKPSPESRWEEHGRLLMFTSKGVQSSTKVRKMYLFKFTRPAT